MYAPPDNSWRRLDKSNRWRNTHTHTCTQTHRYQDNESSKVRVYVRAYMRGCIYAQLDFLAVHERVTHESPSRIRNASRLTLELLGGVRCEGEWNSSSGRRPWTSAAIPSLLPETDAFGSIRKKSTSFKARHGKNPHAWLHVAPASELNFASAPLQHRLLGVSSMSHPSRHSISCTRESQNVSVTCEVYLQRYHASMHLQEYLSVDLSV